jgi:hypothetical protein
MEATARTGVNCEITDEFSVKQTVLSTVNLPQSCKNHSHSLTPNALTGLRSSARIQPKEEQHAGDSQHESGTNTCKRKLSGSW